MSYADSEKCPMRTAQDLLLGQKILTKRPPTFSWIVLPLERLDPVSDFHFVQIDRRSATSYRNSTYINAYALSFTLKILLNENVQTMRMAKI